MSQFESEFARYSGVSQTIALNSGTSALHLALLASGIGPGDEVISVPFTFVASVAAIIYAGARPVLVDIDAKTFNMDPTSVEAAMTERTKAILPVHLYGHSADMDPIIEMRGAMAWLSSKIASSTRSRIQRSQSGKHR